MVYITGDIHGQRDIKKVTKREWKEQERLTRGDYLIQLGDLGLLWREGREYRYLKDFWTSRKYTLLWVDGNHENYDKLKEYREEEWQGGKVDRIEENIIHLKRGEIYEIEGDRYFSFGGGESLDRHMRVEGVDWWREEEMSYKEGEEGMRRLEEAGSEVDYIISHSGPGGIVKEMFGYEGNSRTERYLEEIRNRVRFKKWYFGHYHEDMEYMMKYECLYRSIKRIR